ncbi:hypothetical protein BH23THE1_BH23THE1_23470 [soil metagenome]
MISEIMFVSIGDKAAETFRNKSEHQKLKWNVYRFMINE